MIFRGPKPLIDEPAMVLVLVGAISMGVAAAFHFNFLNWALGGWERTAEILVGLAGIWQLLRQRWFG